MVAFADRHRGDPAFRDALLDLASRYADRDRISRHYLHLGERQQRTYFAEGKEVQLKKIFYALRPAAALRWLRQRPEAAIAPMHLPTLMAECRPPEELAALVADLIERKALTRELGSAPLPDPVRMFIEDEFRTARTEQQGPQRRPSRDSVAAAEAVFRRLVARFDPHAALRSD